MARTDSMTRRPPRLHVRSLLRVLSVWRQRLETRTTLRKLDPHLLRDIGIATTQARQEAQKPFWLA